ncbi:MAG: hypothetical protein GXP62_08950 [Oligoflexia bacterium]|nr:hypothetical protein [Oligoflexia bacterium]
MTPLLLLLSLAPARAGTDQVHSSDSGIVMRPDTTVVDRRLSTGAIENLVTVYVDAGAFVKGLMPTAPLALPKPPEGLLSTAPSFPPTGQLVLSNEHADTAVVSVNGTEIGTVHALNEAVLHSVRSGCYDITWAYRDASSFHQQICTVATAQTPFPGGPSAAKYLDQGRPDRTEPQWRLVPLDQDQDQDQDPSTKQRASPAEPAVIDTEE